MAGIGFATVAHMAVEVESAQPSGFVVVASGAVTLGECLQAQADLLAHPDFGTSAGLLIDGRAVTSAPTTSELRQIARQLKSLRDRGLGYAAIVAGDDFVYGVARMFGVFARSVGVDVAAFRSVDAARRWLAGGRQMTG